MGWFVRHLLRWFGYRVHERKHLTPVSSTIEMLRTPKAVRWFWGGLAHFCLAGAGLVALLLLRKSEITHGWRELAALIVAITWVWIGPACIWYYERYTLPILNMHCRQHLADPVQRRRIQKQIFSHPLRLPVTKLFVIAWMSAITYAFTGTMQFVQGYGIRGYRDPFWWMFLGGVLFLGFYTALGCCLAFKAVGLVRFISRSAIKPRLYHDDRVMGLSFIGDFALITNLMFASGWLFVPVLVMAAQNVGVRLLDNRVLLIISYSCFLLLLFLVPVISIHGTIVKVKRDLFHTFGFRAAHTLDRLTVRYNSHIAGEFEVHRSVIADIHFVRDWPLSLEVALNFAASTILFPIIVSLIVIWLERR
jgi:hypothetical protein